MTDQLFQLSLTTLQQENAELFTATRQAIEQAITNTFHETQKYLDQHDGLLNKINDWLSRGAKSEIFKLAGTVAGNVTQIVSENVGNPYTQETVSSVEAIFKFGALLYNIREQKRERKALTRATQFMINMAAIFKANETDQETDFEKWANFFLNWFNQPGNQKVAEKNLTLFIENLQNLFCTRFALQIKQISKGPKPEINTKLFAYHLALSVLDELIESTPKECSELTNNEKLREWISIKLNFCDNDEVRLPKLSYVVMNQREEWSFSNLVRKALNQDRSWNIRGLIDRAPLLSSMGDLYINSNGMEHDKYDKYPPQLYVLDEDIKNFKTAYRDARPLPPNHDALITYKSNLVSVAIKYSQKLKEIILEEKNRLTVEFDEIKKLVGIADKEVKNNLELITLDKMNMARWNLYYKVAKEMDFKKRSVVLDLLQEYQQLYIQYLYLAYIRKALRHKMPIWELFSLEKEILWLDTLFEHCLIVHKDERPDDDTKKSIKNIGKNRINLSKIKDYCIHTFVLSNWSAIISLDNSINLDFLEYKKTKEELLALHKTLYDFLQTLTTAICQGTSKSILNELKQIYENSLFLPKLYDAILAHDLNFVIDPLLIASISNNMKADIELKLNQLFMFSIINGDEIVNLLIEKFPQQCRWNTPDEYLRAQYEMQKDASPIALHVACQYNRETLFDRLFAQAQNELSTSMPKFTEYRSGTDTILQSAAKNGHLSILRKLLQANAMPNHPNEKIELLRKTACSNSHQRKECLEELFKKCEVAIIKGAFLQADSITLKSICSHFDDRTQPTLELILNKIKFTSVLKTALIEKSLENLKMLLENLVKSTTLAEEHHFRQQLSHCLQMIYYLIAYELSKEEKCRMGLYLKIPFFQCDKPEFFEDLPDRLKKRENTIQKFSSFNLTTGNTGSETALEQLMDIIKSARATNKEEEKLKEKIGPVLSCFNQIAYSANTNQPWDRVFFNLLQTMIYLLNYEIILKTNKCKENFINDIDKSIETLRAQFDNIFTFYEAQKNYISDENEFDANELINKNSELEEISNKCKKFVKVLTAGEHVEANSMKALMEEINDIRLLLNSPLYDFVSMQVKFTCYNISMKKIDGEIKSIAKNVYKKLLNKNQSPYPQNSNDSLLKLLKFLMANHLNGENGISAFHLTARLDNFFLFNDLLKKYKAMQDPISLEIFYKAEDGTTILHDIINSSLQSQTKLKFLEAVLDSLPQEQQQRLINTPGPKNNTALHDLSLKHVESELYVLLIDRGADVLLKDSENKTPHILFREACVNKNIRAPAEIERLLVQNRLPSQPQSMRSSMYHR